MVEIISDLTYIERAKAGDKEAFGALYEKYQKLIENYVQRRVRSLEDVEDITAETFLKALKGLPTYKPIAPFPAWLYRIAHNQVIDFVRERNPQLPLKEEILAERDEDFNPDLSLERSEIASQVREAISTLSPQQTRVVTGYYFNDLPLKQVAERMGITYQATRVHMHRAYISLRSKLINVA